MAIRNPWPAIRDYADALSVLFSNKVPASLRRLAMRAIALVTPVDPKPKKSASVWLQEQVRGWSQAKLLRRFRRSVRLMQRGYCAVPGQFQPVSAEERLKCFAVLADEIKRRAAKQRKELVTAAVATHNTRMQRPQSRLLAAVEKARG